MNNVRQRFLSSLKLSTTSNNSFSALDKTSKTVIFQIHLFNAC
ncbi:hypothetical protein DERF_013454 [Dermatophagoides farinae]|uniref:Uncharacterized protein n=1 Tax=Dermatophagoides farinae TaxID=6954 RepID=A0A922KV90_DERFA|nr:hypothetical protein DERF_013454 [Dermatophagoides farinae]